MIKRLFSVLSLIVSVNLLAAAVAAEESDAIPSLEGVWLATFKIQTRQGISGATGKLVITEQHDHLFRGSFAWSLEPGTRVRADANRRVGQSGAELFLGLLDWDNRSLRMADAGDRGYWSGRLVGAHAMRLVYAESERHAAVFRAMFVREAPSTPDDG